MIFVDLSLAWDAAYGLNSLRTLVAHDTCCNLFSCVMRVYINTGCFFYGFRLPFLPHACC